jgi:ectoine hydroxylase-related dioxygenase (phytanoyl-CoA dioxygenase family)
MNALLKSGQAGPDVIDFYRENGYYFPLRAIDENQAADIRRRLERFEAAQGEPLKKEHRQKTHLLFPWLADLVREPRILDVVEKIVGPDILVWQTTFFIKEARDTGFVSWHQDSTYWGLSEPEVVTAWVALSPSTLESGCVKVVPGTHKFDQVPHRETRAADNLLTRGQEIAVSVEENKVVNMPLQSGEMSLHHIRTFHSSEPNRSADRRIGFAIRYIPTRIRQTQVDGDSATLVRGTDRYGHFTLEETPAGEFDARAVAHHQQVMGRRRSIYGRGD